MDKVVLLPLSQAPLPEELKLQEVYMQWRIVFYCYYCYITPRGMNKQSELNLAYVYVFECMVIL